mgnify:CR=1 FL=1
MTPCRVIAMDGPAASGKSTVARLLADRLDFALVNSGAFYRAIAWVLLQESGHSVTSEEDTARKILESTNIEVVFEGRSARLSLNGQNPTPHLREPGVNAHVSVISQFPFVRNLLGDIFHSLAAERDCVVEGRDIGTCVFPDTPYKFYIDASPEERQRRRAAEGQTDRVAERDRRDSLRAVAPLTAAPDALRIDTTHLGIEEVLERALAHLAAAGVRPQGT